MEITNNNYVYKFEFSNNQLDITNERTTYMMRILMEEYSQLTINLAKTQYLIT